MSRKTSPDTTMVVRRAGRILATLLVACFLTGFLQPSAIAIQSTTVTTVDMQDLTPDFVKPGTTGIAILKFTIKDSKNETFSHAEVDYRGTAITDVSAVHIYRESGASAGFSAGEDVMMAKVANPAGTPVPLSFTFALVVNVNYMFYVVVNLTANATDGHVVDARIRTNKLTIGGLTWPVADYNPAGSTIVDGVAPGSWAGFTPSDWIGTRSPNCLIGVRDNRSGLAVQRAEYRFSGNGGANWSGWSRANCSGTNGSILLQNISALGVPFPDDSETLNLISFRVEDAIGNLGTSPDYVVKVDTLAPGGWLLRSPLGWHVADKRPTVIASARDTLCGLSNLSASAQYSIDGGSSWRPVQAVYCTGPFGSRAAENLTTPQVPFDQDSDSRNLLRFNISDLAGNWNLSPAYIIKVDSTPPDAPVLEGLPQYSQGTCRNIHWNASPEPVSGLARYVASCDDNADFSSPVQTLEVNTTECSFTGLSDGTRYFYDVAAINNAGLRGNFSLPANTTQDASPPFTVMTTDPVHPDGLNGWFISPVNVNFTAADNTSGVALTHCRVDGGENRTGNGLTLAAEGEHQVEFWSEDNVGNLEPARTVSIKVDFTPPLATIRYPARIYASDPTLFDGSTSIDAEAHTWNFGDGTPNVTGVVVEHTFGVDGLYHVTLTVVDRAGHICATSSDVQVLSDTENNPPAAVIGHLLTIFAGEPAMFNGSGSIDEEPTTLRYEWDFGDGGTGDGATPTYTYPTDGDYTVMLKVTDRHGLSNIATRALRVYTVGVNKPPFAIILQRNSAYVNEPVILDASDSADEDPLNLVFLWEFGDGTTGDGQIASHVFMKDEAFAVLLTITDSGGLSGTATTAVKVFYRGALIAPSAMFSNDPKGPKPGQKVDFNAGLSTCGNASVLNYLWDFGDGTTGEGVLVSHDFPRSGEYRVVLRVSDQYGLSDTYSDIVEVKTPAAPATEFGLTGWLGMAMIFIGLGAIALAALIFTRRRGPAAATGAGPQAAGEAPLPKALPIKESADSLFIENGLSYAFGEEAFTSAVNTLRIFASGGGKGLLVSAIRPSEVIGTPDRNIETVWLSRESGGSRVMDPAGIEGDIPNKIIGFMKENASKGVVLIIGSETMLNEHGLPKVRELVGKIIAEAKSTDTTVLFHMDGKTMARPDHIQLISLFDRAV